MSETDVDFLRKRESLSDLSDPSSYGVTPTSRTQVFEYTFLALPTLVKIKCLSMSS